MRMASCRGGSDTSLQSLIVLLDLLTPQPMMTNAGAERIPASNGVTNNAMFRSPAAGLIHNHGPSCSSPDLLPIYWLVNMSLKTMAMLSRP